MLGDTIWYDVNGNGVQEANEMGLGGVKVKVVNSATQAVITIATTGPDGTWLAVIPEDATPTDYVVLVDTTTLPGGLIATPTNLNGGDTYVATVKAGDVRMNLDFGYKGGTPGVIGDQVFLDANGNGTQQAGEGLSGVTLTLSSIGIIDGYVDINGDGSITASDNGTYGGYVVTAGVLAVGAVNQTINGMSVKSGAGGGLLDVNHDGVIGANDDLVPAVLATTVTDAGGSYLFNGLLAGDYRVNVTGGLPSGLSQTVGVSVPTSVITLAAGASYTDADFGYVAAGTAVIGDRVWSDANGNGTQDPGEVGIGGVTVRLCSDDSCTTTYAMKTTGPDGSYLFSNVTPGSYTVVVAAPGGYAQTFDFDGLGTPNAATLTVGVGQVANTVDFGYRNLTGAVGAIGNTVYNDVNGNGAKDGGDSGIDGVTLDLVTVGAINGLVDLNGDSVITSADTGTYGSYTVTAGVIAAANGTLVYGIPVLNGRLDVNGNGANDDKDYLIPKIVATTTTAGGGLYSFTGLPPGDFRVEVTDTANLLAGKTATQVSGGGIPITCSPACTNNTTTNFGFTAPTTGSGIIGDTVYFDSDGNSTQDNGEIGIGGVTLNLVKAGQVLATTTTSNGTAGTLGTYQFSGLAAGAYQVVVTDTNNVLAGLTATQTAGVKDIVCNPACNTVSDADFGFKSTIGGTGTLGGTVWHDTTFGTTATTGFLDTGEPLLAGVTVELWLDADGSCTPDIATPCAPVPSIDNLVRTTTTNSNGEYTFLGLPPGRYIVKVTDTNGVLAGMTNVLGANPNSTSNNNGHVMPYATTLTLGEVDTSVDFAYKASVTPYTISGTVFEDAGASLGAYNDPATGGDDAYVPGATVTLYREVGGIQYAIGTTTSNSSGAYSFTDLPAGGTYVVKVDISGTLAQGMQETFDPSESGQCKTCDSQWTAVNIAANQPDINFGYWNGNIVTTPVTLAYFKATPGKTKGSVDFEWWTATETGNLGFELFVESGKNRVRISPKPIPGKVTSTEPVRYTYTADGVDGDTFWIVDVSIDDNKRTEHGGYKLGKAFGREPKVKPIEWKAVKKEKGDKKAGRDAKSRKDASDAVQHAAANGGSAAVAELVVVRDGLDADFVRTNFAVSDRVYRVTYEALLAAGMDLKAVALSRLALYSHGRQVPIHVVGDGTGKAKDKDLFGPGSYVEFIGEGEVSLYTDANPYRLVVEKTKGARVAEDTRTLPATFTAAPYYMERVTKEREWDYAIESPNGDPWFDEYLVAWGGPSGPLARSITVDQYVPDAAPAQLEVGLWGVTALNSTPDHHVVIGFNNQDNVADRLFDGRTDGTVKVTLPATLLLEGDNSLTLKLPYDLKYGVDEYGNPGYDMIALDSYSVTYPRRFAARNGRLSFVAAGAAFTVTGLTEQPGRGLPDRWQRR